MGQAASHVRLTRGHARERGSVCVGGRERESGWDGDHAHGSQRAASVASGALAAPTQRPFAVCAWHPAEAPAMDLDRPGGIPQGH